MEADPVKPVDQFGAFRLVMSKHELHAAKQELQRLWRTTPLNRYFIPISKLPPLGPDPRIPFGSHPPRCCPKGSGTSRAGRLLRRWASMPSSGQPLDRDLADELTAWKEFMSESSCKSSASRQPQPSLKGHSLRAVAAPPKPKFTADGKEYPFIPCTCCERSSPIPRIYREPLGEVAAAAVSEYTP
mmetsp:Transcript_13990/g.26122  ORF Transcript_13990/g.26122 Transcript_13990/m.26122 type:complete len:186 (-) Transcript_13990:131-688(-)